MSAPEKSAVCGVFGPTAKTAVIKSNPGSGETRDGASSDSQPLRALRIAQGVRIEQGRWRREVAAMPGLEARRHLAELLEAGINGAIGRLPLYRFLSAADHLGPRKAEQIAGAALMIRRNPRVCELTARERVAIAQELRRRADGRPL